MWVRVSEEYGWNGLDRLKATCDAAHARGLKVVQAVQIAGHKYDDPAKNAALPQFAVQCVDAGADLIEVGNEFNHTPFWQAPPVTTMPPAAQAVISIAVAKAVKAAHPSTPVITNGMSPEADPLNPWTWWPQFLDADIAGHVGAKWDGIGLHPYCYPELATANPAQWNPILQVPSIRTAAQQRGITTAVYLTELGAPGFPVATAPVIRNVALTEQRQADCYSAYLSVIRQQESAGITYPLVCFATLFDGQSATTSVEQGLGLIRADGTKKPAYDIVKAFAAEAV